MSLTSLYDTLLLTYGKQDWWPLNHLFSPKEWEICVGAILTQNTSWKNVEKALHQLQERGITSVDRVIRTPTQKLEHTIRPAGFYTQKAQYLKTLAQYIFSFPSFDKFLETVTRTDLLSLKGIGEETADAILLYAAQKPSFVIDAYTRRVFSRVGLVSSRSSYKQLQAYAHENLKKDAALFNEFHALLVEHAKQFCRTKPRCISCPLEESCKKLY